MEYFGFLWGGKYYSNFPSECNKYVVHFTGLTTGTPSVPIIIQMYAFIHFFSKYNKIADSQQNSRYNLQEMLSKIIPEKM